ncbi:heavy-metal-associated domain-containing protein [Streptomyces winkii]|uniref:heavy-metal-associated domain-containing protein n=1 Tax=Streptomyces winkii TaxID=3051178 RepID=UPI0028D257FB|nr:heavy-metal-associated domain-containing protein [Streptomyces sp. DSM 40971]
MASCCTPDGSCHTDGTTTVYNVSGMTCAHCRAAVTEAVGGLETVRSVSVDVEAGRVTVTTGGEPDDALIAEAVDDAGYELTGRAATA